MHPIDYKDHRGPSTRRRVIALAFGATYLTIFAFVFAQVTTMSLLVTGPMVVAGASAIVAVLAVLAGRLARQEQGKRRFGLSSVFLSFVPLSIYLAALRVLFGSVTDEGLPLVAWFVLSVFAVVLVALTTVVLVRMAEAGMWFILQMQRRNSEQGKLQRRRDDC